MIQTADTGLQAWRGDSVPPLASVAYAWTGERTGMEVIQTTYKGIKYRSRTEARWAAFFDAAGVTVHYEPEGHELPSGRYLPDFYAPNEKAYFEVKGQAPTDRELQLAHELEEATGRNVFFLVGQPNEGEASVLWAGIKCHFGRCRRCPALWLCAQTSWMGLPHPACDPRTCPGKFTYPMTDEIRFASTQRFGVHE